MWVGFNLFVLVLLALHLGIRADHGFPRFSDLEMAFLATGHFWKCPVNITLGNIDTPLRCHVLPRKRKATAIY